MKNEPNLPGRLGPPGIEMCETNPIRPRRQAAASPEGQNARNEPNLVASNVQNEPNLPESSADPGGEMCKTNPIPGRRDTPLFHYSIIPPFQSDAKCAKRSQFLARTDAMDLESATVCRPHPVPPVHHHLL
jgi:hypothetical protein